VIVEFCWKTFCSILSPPIFNGILAEVFSQMFFKIYKKNQLLSSLAKKMLECGYSIRSQNIG
jgi:hypothetical protein